MIHKTAAILAGGLSTRMGSNKSLLKIGEESFLEIIIKKLSDYKEVFIVSNEPKEYEFLNVNIVEDIIKQKGPLSGIHSALKHATYNECLCIACDMPLISKEILNFIGNFNGNYDALVPIIDERIQPLCAIYKKKCIDKIEYCLKNDIRRVKKFYEYIDIKNIYNKDFKFIDLKDKFKNINTLEEYKKIKY